MPMLIRIAWRNIWRQKRRTMITVGAMSAGLAFCMAMVAFIDGFVIDMFEVMVTESQGHAQLHHPEYPKKRAMYESISDADALLTQLEGRPEVARASARLFGASLLGSEAATVGVQLTGIEPAHEAALTKLDEKVTEGRYLAAEPKREIVIGYKLAKKLKVELGDEVVAVTQSADGAMGNELYTVVGLLKTGSVAQDKAGAFLHLADAQALLALDGQVHEISLVAPTREGIDAMIGAVETIGAEQGLLVRSWSAINPQLAQYLQMGDASLGVLLFIIFGVAGIGILNTMLMSVFERTKELGVIRALGLRPLQMVSLVLWETVALVVVAVAIGVPLGLGFDAYLIHHGLDLSSVYSDVSMMGVNFDPVMRGAFRADRVFQIVIGLLTISLLAAIWPSIRAARLQPVEAMRMD